MATSIINQRTKDFASEKGLKNPKFKTSIFEMRPRRLGYLEKYGILSEKKTANDDNYLLHPISITIDAFYPEKYDTDMVEYMAQTISRISLKDY